MRRFDWLLCSCMYLCFILSIDLSSLPLFVSVALIAEAT